MARRGGEVPDAVLAARIRVRIVGAADLAVRRRDLVLATALLAVVLVLVQREPVVARALVRAGRVLALVLAAAVVHRALVHVCENRRPVDSATGFDGRSLRLLLARPPAPGRGPYPSAEKTHAPWVPVSTHWALWLFTIVAPVSQPTRSGRGRHLDFAGHCGAAPTPVAPSRF